MSILNKLTEGIVNRNLSKEGAALRDKWERTGLLEGLENERQKDGMSVILENQAKELLREVSTMAAGDVEGFAAVAFPIVRRVFGSLVANELVSVQPMSLPSGLIFFLDFTFNSAKLGEPTDGSLFGGGVVGQQVTGGVDLTGLNAERSFYNLNNGYASPTASAALAGGPTALALMVAAGQVGVPDNQQGDLDLLVNYDPDLSGSLAVVLQVTGGSDWGQFNTKDLVAIAPTGTLVTANMVRRLSSIPTASATGRPNTVPNPDGAGWLLNVVFVPTASIADQGAVGLRSIYQRNGAGILSELTVSADNNADFFGLPISDNFNNVTAEGDARGLGAIVGVDTWGLENQTAIPEIDIKVDSVSVTAVTKKLKAKWTPELGQDLNAYHNLDAEVELTSILSEQIALEIDREILEDLVKGATGGTLFWSRLPGNFVNRETGVSLELINTAAGYPEFTGTVSEWYETLIETVNDVSARIHRKTLRGGANFIVVGPEVANLLEFTSGFRANVTADDNKGTVGAVNVGNLSKKWDVFVDPYFVRNLILVGRKGNSFLESGYVYAPYVPLQVTPTIFGPEDFVPRKGVMTRYAKKMVRPDLYGLVIVRDLV